MGPARGPPALHLDNVLLSPHNAGLSKEAAIRMAILTARNALAGIDGKVDPLDGGQPRGALTPRRTGLRRRYQLGARP